MKKNNDLKKDRVVVKSVTQHIVTNQIVPVITVKAQQVKVAAIRAALKKA